ncbi:MAG: hypothetical protein E6H07_18640 [Bacteroidetes bacterium]|nr:MAG: hypothetical protein E6H07_18640 [Bacteroidota bacterium]
MNVAYNRIFVFTLLSLLVVLSSCSQTATGIYKTASYYKINTPGTIPVDDSGNEIGRNRDTIREIYIVTKSVKAPEIIAVVIDHHYYIPVISKIDSNKIYVGERLPDNQRVELNAGAGLSLWKITVGEAMRDLVIIKEKSPPSFYLYIKYKGKNRIHQIKNSVELVPELHY